MSASQVWTADDDVPVGSLRKSLGVRGRGLDLGAVGLLLDALDRAYAQRDSARRLVVALEVDVRRLTETIDVAIDDRLSDAAP